MSTTLVAGASAACIFSGTLVGLALSRVVPGHHLTADSKEAVKLGAGMISMMGALVLGLLVSSAKSNFDRTSAAVTEGAAKVILLDRVLAQYGPETREVRAQFRQALAARVEALWSKEAPTPATLKTLERGNAMERLLVTLRELKPQTDAQRALLAQAVSLGNELLLSRWVQIEQAQVPLPVPFFVIMLFWLTLLYLCFGLLAPRNLTVISVMFVGALALATALFLILEMNSPMDGAIRVSGAPMRNALEHLGR